MLNGSAVYGNNAIKLVDTYTSRLVGYNDTNAPLQAGWTGAMWTRAAELLRFYAVGPAPAPLWPEASAAAFAKMVTSIHVPLVFDGSPNNGNWELSMIEAMANIAVFTENSTLLHHATLFWNQRVPSYLFDYSLDGGHPVPAPRGSVSWYGQTVFNATTSGVCQETCRDMGHTCMGFAGAFDTAETAWIQGIDLYQGATGMGTRLVGALEFNANIMLGAPPRSYVCDGKIANAQIPTFVVAYNAMHNRLNYTLPVTLEYITQVVQHLPDQVVPGNSVMMIFELLTHWRTQG